MTEQKCNSILSRTIKWLNLDRGFHISIHDTSGILHSLPELYLPVEFSIHQNHFCDIAKTTDTGLRTCLRCKHRSILKAILQNEAFIGKCYLGVSEIVKPIYFNDRLICVIYIGNFLLDSNKFDMKSKIEKICRITGVKESDLLEAQTTLKIVSKEQLEEYTELSEILSHMIITVLKDNPVRGKSSSTSPIYLSTTHWLIQMVQNYIASYYNRDLKLSQLAKIYFMNPQYMCRLFKQETGMNFTDYVNMRRIDIAKKALAETDEVILKISLSIGFNNVTYFNRLFKKITGMTPTEYRHSAINKKK